MRQEFRTGLAPEVRSEPGFEARCAAWMATRLLADAWLCWIAEDGPAAPVGMVWVQLLEKLPNPVGEPELHAYLTSFYVRPIGRNRGIGSALLDVSLAACRSRGVDSVILWPTPRSRPLYLRSGFAERTGVLELRLWGGPESAG